MANLYIDLTNGTDGGGGTLHDGLMEDNSGSNYAAIASTDNTHTYIAQGALDNDADDNYNGDYIYNVTRSLGALISDYDADDGSGNSVLVHAAIAGNVDTDEFYIIRACLTLNYVTSTLARSAGDNIYIRANTTGVSGATDITFDEDGTQDDRISIIGCDATTNDPWGDASDVMPDISFGTNSFQVALNGDDYWWIERIVFADSSDTEALNFYNSDRTYIKDCTFEDNTNGGITGGTNSQHTVIDGCDFEDNGGENIYCSGGEVLIKSCTIDAGGGGTDDGIYITNCGTAHVIDCDIGLTNAHTTADVYARDGGRIWMRNCELGTTGTQVYPIGGVIFEEDADAVRGAQTVTVYHGTITKDTGVNRSGAGGADSSAKMEPNTLCGPYAPLTLNNESEIDLPFKLWIAAALTTVTIYIRALGTWGTYPTASELYLEANYISDAGASADRTTVVSNDVLSHASDWKAFDVTFTPVQAGWVYLNVFLKLYEDAGDGCYVDIAPVVT